MSNTISTFVEHKPKVMNRNKTQEKFIEKIKTMYPNLEIIGEYINNNSDMLVKDKYGILISTPKSLMEGHTPNIRSAKDKTQYFKNQLKDISPEIEVTGEYVGNKIKIKLASKFGDCLMLPNTLLAGRKPTIRAAINKTEYLVNQFKAVHGDKYDYSKVEYVNFIIKVCIVCPIHGEFWQTPNSHLQCQGCPKCTYESITSNTESFIKKARKVHGDEYDYSKVDYKGARMKVIIICKKHGEFLQTPNKHLSGNTCLKCSNAKRCK